MTKSCVTKLCLKDGVWKIVWDNVVLLCEGEKKVLYVCMGKMVCEK